MASNDASNATSSGTSYDVIETAGVPIKAWTRGVAIEDAARKQLENVARLPVVFHHVAVMPDVHFGIGATVGSVVPTERAIIPAAVGVDIGCGMMAVRTSARATDLPDDLRGIRSAIEAAVPHGRTDNGGRNDRGAWHQPPAVEVEAWAAMRAGYERIIARHPRLDRGSHIQQLGTLGTGNHFIEL
ncbi:MAG TPA: RtcB family protein, partial [Kofleriaceae bacterium]